MVHRADGARVQQRHSVGRLSSNKVLKHDGMAKHCPTWGTRSIRWIAKDSYGPQSAVSRRNAALREHEDRLWAG
jgi:hypothetical protein